MEEYLTTKMSNSTDHPSFLNPDAASAASETTRAFSRQKSMEIYRQSITSQMRSELEMLQLQMRGESSQHARNIALGHDSPVDHRTAFLCKTCLILGNELAIVEQKLNRELDKRRREDEQASELCLQKLAILQTFITNLEDEVGRLEGKNALLSVKNERLERCIGVARGRAWARILELRDMKQKEGVNGDGKGKVDREDGYKDTNAELIRENAALKKEISALRDENVKIKGGWFEERTKGADVKEESGEDVDADGLTPRKVWQEWWRGINDLLLRYLGSCDKRLVVGVLVGMLGIALFLLGQTEGGEL
jgi:hypothetical protein